ncbi:MAG: hypothetical protein M3264_04245 [Thermoproteota archaeon]|nr:hypothetical protein [Thermoproteota archaeon]
MSIQEEKKIATFRQHRPGVSTFSTPGPSSELIKTTYFNENGERIDPYDNDIITAVNRSLKESREAYKPMAEHLARWEGIEIRRSNILAALRMLDRDQQEFLNAEKYDSKLARAGEEKRSEIAKDR